MDIFSVLFYQPVYNLLILFYRLFGENLGIAIILVGILTRVVILPFSLKQMKFADESKKMNEEIKLIRKKYKDQKEKMQEELLKVQSKYLPGQLSGCLPLILQFIFLINIYNVINDIINKGVESFNKIAYSFVGKFPEAYVLNNDFFGIVDLTKSYSSVSNSTQSTEIIGYLILVFLVGVTQYLSIKLSTNNTKSNLYNDKNDETKDQKLKNETFNNKEENDDLKIAMQKTQSQLVVLFPIMIVLISLSFPTGLVLYWIVQNVFVIIQYSFKTLFLKKLN